MAKYVTVTIEDDSTDKLIDQSHTQIISREPFDKVDQAYQELIYSALKQSYRICNSIIESEVLALQARLNGKDEK